MTVHEAEHLRLENLRLWTLVNRLNQETLRLQQGLRGRGVQVTDFGNNSITAALLTIDLFRTTAEDLAKEFEKLRQGMAARGLDLDRGGNTPGSITDIILAWLDMLQQQRDAARQKQLAP